MLNWQTGTSFTRTSVTNSLSSPLDKVISYLNQKQHCFFLLITVGVGEKSHPQLFSEVFCVTHWSCVLFHKFTSLHGGSHTFAWQLPLFFQSIVGQSLPFTLKPTANPTHEKWELCTLDRAQCVSLYLELYWFPRFWKRHWPLEYHSCH